MKHELLAPAGNLEVFYAVVNAGADAVYIGGPKFGARAYAKNFTSENIIEAITYAHLHGVRVYMTVNTLIKNQEMEECISMMVPFYEVGLDGVIVQDIGVVRRFRQEFPEMEIHTSTQMSISDVEGALLMKEAGAVRVVTSRELSLDEIRRIRKEADIEIECFIHGALCYCYSGQCLMSSMIGGRSGNRGRCAQPCRLPYEVLDANGKRVEKACEILSLKDLCTIEFLPDLLEAGIDSLKIEGRMKQASYAYTVVSIYRKYLDMYLEKGRKGYQVSKEDYQTLLDAGNRNGFTDGYYYKHNEAGMVTRHGSAHNNQDLQIDTQEISRKKQRKINGSVFLEKNKPMVLTLSCQNVQIEVYGECCQEAKKAGLELSQVEKQFRKTGGSNFEFENLSINLGEGVFVPVSAMNQLRRDGFEELTKSLGVSRRYGLEKTESLKKKEKTGKKHCSVLVSDRNQLNVILKKDYIERIYLELISFELSSTVEIIKEMKQIKEADKEAFLALPCVLRHGVSKKLKGFLDSLIKEEAGLLDGFLVRSYDEINLARTYGVKLVADETIYTFSNDAVLMRKEFGLEEDTVPYELKDSEIYHRDGSESELLVYGRIPVMISAGCVNKNTKGCDQNMQWLWLKDRKGFLFPVRNYCYACYNVIYNSTPTCLFQTGCEDMLVTVSKRLSFTNETVEQVEEVLKLYEENVLGEKVNASPLKNFTWGHFHRGVE